MGNDNSIDLGLKNIWDCWWEYKKGKKKTQEFYEFQEKLEENLYRLFLDLNNGRYRHGGYRKFIVADNKRREISVSPIRDKIVHRLIYDYLIRIYDKTFISDAWSCRKGKGLLGAIERTQYFLRKYPKAWIWRADIRRFFENVDHEILLKIISHRVKDEKSLKLIEKIIRSHFIGGSKGMPIGNLTSQIFANIYMNELDRYVKHELKPAAYLRYGDDFLLMDGDREKLLEFRERVRIFLKVQLKLDIHKKNNFPVKARQGLKFLGVVLFPNGRKLNKRNRKRILNRLEFRNAGSYTTSP